ANARPANPGPAPPRSEKWFVRPSSPYRGNAPGCDAKTGLGLERLKWKAKVVWKPRGPYSRREKPHHAFAVDRRPVRPDAVVEGRGVGEEPVGPQARAERHPRPRRREDRRAKRRRRDRGVEPRRTPARRRDVVDPRAARGGRSGGRQGRGVARRRNPQRPGRAAGARA